MKKIFVIGLGGRKQDVNIEIHDIQFVVAETFEETFEILKKNWYGDSLHLDEYCILEGVSDYRIELSETKIVQKEALYFVNMGGYHTGEFGEIHQNGFFVANSLEEAKQESKKSLLPKVENQHVDNIHLVEERLQSIDGKTYYIHLIASEETYTFKADWNGYLKLF